MVRGSAQLLNGECVQLDWVGLFRKGECTQTTETRLPDPQQATAEHNYINKVSNYCVAMGLIMNVVQCFLATESIGSDQVRGGPLDGGAKTGQLRFGPEAYGYKAGEYEVFETSRLRLY